MRTLSSLILLFFLLVFPVSLNFAQSPEKIDSLLKLINSGKQDTMQVVRLNELAAEYFKIKPARSLELSMEALALARHLNFNHGIALSNASIGESDLYLGKFEDGKQVLTEAIKSFDAKHDKSIEARMYHLLGRMNAGTGNFEEAFKNHAKSISIKEELKDSAGLATSYNALAQIYYGQGKFDDMKEIAGRANTIFEKLHDSLNLGETYNILGMANYAKGEYSPATKYFLQSIKIREKYGNKYGVAGCYNNLGSIKINQGDFNGALNYYNEARKLYEEIGDNDKMGVAYYSIGLVYMHQGKNKEALEYFFRTVDIKKKSGDKSILGLAYGNIGEIFYQLKEYNKALQHHLEGNKILNELGDRRGIAMSSTAIGKIYSKIGKYNEAQKYFETGLKLSGEIGEKEVMKTTYESISEMYEFKNDYKNALASYKLFTGMKDSLLNDNTNKQIAELTEAFNAEKKENENALLKQENLLKTREGERQKQVRNIIIFGSILLLASLSFAFYNFYTRRKITFARTVERVNNKALRSQMNPHFMFNALQSIQSYLNSNNAKDANDYLHKFSKLMRLVLENSQHQEVSIADDKEALELYMQLERVRLKHPFTYQFNVDEKIDINKTMIPPLLLQPFVENAIWHGLQNKDSSGNIYINISQKGYELHCSIEDNGIGRDLNKIKDQPMLIKKESLGMKLTAERLKIISEIKKIKSDFKIVDLVTDDQIPKGTRVELSIPLS